MIPTLKQMKAISTATKFSAATVANMESIIAGLEYGGAKFGLDLPHRLAKYLGQMAHESGGFKYDKEIWKNTPAQLRYDTRTDLGNTPERDGDGELYKGRTGIQLTGKANYQAFTTWAKKHFGAGVPNFVKNPDQINTDPWEGLVPIWYWAAGNPSRKSLNGYADENNDEMITRRINGGLNGFNDRVANTVRASLVLLGYGPTQIKEAQKVFWPKDKSQWDGIAGPQTRAKLHEALALMSSGAIKKSPSITVKKAPVVQKEEVAVVPEGTDKAGADTAIVLGGLGLGTAGPEIAKQILPTFGGLSSTVQVVLLVIAAILIAWFILRRFKLAATATTLLNQINGRNSDGLPN